MERRANQLSEDVALPILAAPYMMLIIHSQITCSQILSRTFGDVNDNASDASRTMNKLGVSITKRCSSAGSMAESGCEFVTLRAL
jgi:hypothetical protein